MRDDGPALILTPDLRDPGGVANYFNVLRLHESADVEYFHVNSADPESLLRRIWRLFSNYIRFVWKLLGRRYRLIHMNPSLNLKSFLRDGVFLLLARLSSAPVLVFFRGWDDQFAGKILSSRLMHWFFRVTYGRCRYFIVLGERFKQRLIDLGCPDDSKIWIDTTVADSRLQNEAMVREKIRAEADEVIVLFMSRLLVQKGVLLAIDAVRQYQTMEPTSKPPIRLWIAGSGPDEERVRAHVRANALDFVEFLGDVRGTAKWQALESARVLLFPTCYPEGLANVVLEGMLHGLPVITRREGALEEIVCTGTNGFITDSTDPNVFAEYLQKLATNRAVYEKMALTNLEEGKRFSREQVSSRLLSIYDQIGEG